MSERVVTPGFHERVFEVVRLVPDGFVTTYGDVATHLGSPRVARHVGWALAAAWLSARVGAVRKGMHWLERAAGAMFLGFGLKLALSDNPQR